MVFIIQKIMVQVLLAGRDSQFQIILLIQIFMKIRFLRIVLQTSQILLIPE